jgi:hypothetical protein
VVVIFWTLDGNHYRCVHHADLFLENLSCLVVVPSSLKENFANQFIVFNLREKSGKLFYLESLLCFRLNEGLVVHVLFLVERLSLGGFLLFVLARTCKIDSLITSSCTGASE